MTTPTPTRPYRQRGAALLTAMIIVTLVATLAVSMVWQQWRAVQVETAERARTQSAWILSGALDFARRILREDKLNYVGLTSPWATPLAESRISTFLAADTASDTTNDDSGPEAFLSGTITDAQGRYNITNLVSTDKVQDAAQLEVLTRLCQNLGLDVGIAQRISSGMHDALAPTPSAAAPLVPTTVAQLSWLGLDDASITALQPYIVVLPKTTPLNVNTAPKEVLAAVLAIDSSAAAKLVQTALRTPFQDMTTFGTAAAGTSAVTLFANVTSSYFEVRGRLRLADHVLVERSLLFVNPDKTSIVIQRELVSSLEQVGLLS